MRNTLHGKWFVTLNSFVEKKSSEKRKNFDPHAMNIHRGMFYSAFLRNMVCLVFVFVWVCVEHAVPYSITTDKENSNHGCMISRFVCGVGNGGKWIGKTRWLIWHTMESVDRFLTKAKAMRGIHFILHIKHNFGGAIALNRCCFCCSCCRWCYCRCIYINLTLLIDNSDYLSIRCCHFAILFTNNSDSIFFSLQFRPSNVFTSFACAIYWKTINNQSTTEIAFSIRENQV